MKTGISYFGVRNPEFVSVDLQQIASLEYTHILHTYSEEDLEYYADTMDEIISLSNKFGLKVYVNPWGVGRVFGGEAYSELAAKNPDWCQINSLGERLVASCINHSGFREYMHHWIDTVCNTEVETIFWDEPHFYFTKGVQDVWACTCPVCQKKFRKLFNHTMPGSITNSVKQFRHACIVDFLQEMTDHVRSRGKRNSVCLLPPWFNDGVDDWASIAQINSIDELGSDPYWEKEDKSNKISRTYHEVSHTLKKVCDQYGKEAQIWIKNYDIVRNTEDSVAEATWAAYNEGIRNIFAWSYKGSAYMSKLRSDDPEKVWEIQSNTFAECLEKEQNKNI
jgi:hypothetical protein